MNNNPNNERGENLAGQPNLLLDACAEAIRQNFPDVRCEWSSSYSGERVQQLELYIPESKFPIPKFDPQGRSWSKMEFVKPLVNVEQEDYTSEPIAQTYIMRQDGTLVYGDPEGNTFLRLTHSFELVEILEFLLGKKQKLHTKTNFFAQENSVKRKFSAVFPNLNLVVCIEGQPYILDVKRHFEEMPEDFRLAAEKHFIILTYRRSEAQLQSSWRSVCESHSTYLKSLNLPKLPPFGFIWRFSFFKLLRHTHYQCADDFDTLGIYFAPNLKKTSITFLSDYFDYTQEGEIIISNLENAGSLRDLTTLVSEIGVEVPRDKNQQVRWSIELRATREYIRIASLYLSHELTKAEKTLDITWRKWRGIGVTRSAYMEEVDSLLQPLPYFIEKPYRDFLRADSGYEKAHAGVSFASKLYKVMACLAVEEFEQNWPSSGNPKPTRLALTIADVDSGKPISDGTWVTLFKDIYEQATDYIPLMVSIGSGYYQKLDEIFELISTRNKCWGHSTESDRLSRLTMRDTLETKMSEILPTIISVLRNGFRGSHILIPLNSEFREGIGQVFRAKSVMGFEPDFDTVVMPVVEGIENYIDRQLIMYSRNAFVALRKHFSCDEIGEDFFQVSLKE